MFKYKQGFIKEELIDEGFIKLYKETDSKSIHITKILLELSSLVKKRNNKLSLTKKGSELLNDNSSLFSILFETFTTKFNWSYNDNYADEKIGQWGFGFTFILLNKYGQEYQSEEFYAAKYLKAFKFESDSVDPYMAQVPNRIYIVRTFKRFLNYFGITEYENNSKDGRIKATKLFSQLIEILPHQNL